MLDAEIAFAKKIKKHKKTIIFLYEMDSMVLPQKELTKILSRLLDESRKEIDFFIQEMVQISEEDPEGKVKDWVNEYIESTLE